MKIIILGMQLAGLINFRGPLIRDLQAAGHEVVAVAAEVDQLWLPKLAELNVRFVAAPLKRTSLNPFSDLIFLLWLFRFLRRERPDCLFAFQIKAVAYGLMAAWLARVPKRAAMIEGMGIAFSPGEKPVLRFIMRMVLTSLYMVSLRCAQVLFLLNRDDFAFFTRRRFIGKGTRAVLLDGIGVDLDYFSASTPPEGPPVILMMARTQVDKGLRVYAESARIFKQRHPAARFILLGGRDRGPARIEDKELEKWQKDGLIEYQGEVTDVRPALAEAQVVVLLSLYREGLPRSLMEAMASGRAIIATNIPGARETVIAGKNGILVEPGDVSAFVAALEQIIAEPALVQAMGAAGRRLAENRFAVGLINRRILSELERL